MYYEEIVLNKFKLWLLSGGRAETTTNKHLIRLRVILNTIPEWTGDALQMFLSKKVEEGVSNATLNSYVDTIRVYCRHVGCDPKDCPTGYFKKKNKIKGVLSNEEVETLVTLPAPDKANKKIWNTWSLFFKMMAYTGCRPGEVAQLKLNDVDFGRGVFEVNHTKTGVPRLVPIPPNLIEELKAYIDKLECAALFTTRKCKPFTTDAWYHAFKKRIEIMGIKRDNITPYSLRHTYITNLLNEDVNIHKIAKLVGHDIKMTQKYEHLTTKDIHKAAEKHPTVRKYLNPQNTLDYLEEVAREILNDPRLEVQIKRKRGELTLEVHTCNE